MTAFRMFLFRNSDSTFSSCKKKLFQFGVPEMSFNSHWGILAESPADMCLAIY